MPKVTACLQIGASAEFEALKPDNWDAMSQFEKVEYFLMEAYAKGYLCHQCSKHLETDFDPIELSTKEEIEGVGFTEE